MKTTSKKDIKNLEFAVALMMLVCIVAVIVAIIAVLTPNTEKGEFVPPPFDANVQSGIPDVPEDLLYGELPVSKEIPFRVSICKNVKIQGSQAFVYFTNAEDNEVWMKLRFMDENGNTLSDTGIIKPGEYLSSVEFSSLPDGETGRMIIKIMTYEPETYISAGSINVEVDFKNVN